MALLFLLALAASCSSAESEGSVADATDSEARISPEAASANVSDTKYAAPQAQGESRANAAEPVPLRPDSLAAIYRQHAKSGSATTGQSDVQSAMNGAGSLAADTTRRSDIQQAMDVVVVLARYSSPDSYESALRERAVEELRTRFESRNLSDGEALDLLDTIAPEAAINARREAAKKLAELSDKIEDEDWADRNTLDAAEEITRLITGEHLHAERRIEAAKELTRRSKAGELDTDGALDLMNDIAPELSISERRQAAANLARLSQTERWDAETTKQAGEETFRLVTGDKLNIERRTEAAVDLTGEALKRFGGDEFEDEDIDVSTELIKSSLRGDLTTDKVSDLLGFDD